MLYMISVQTANKYYESLRFNHYESGGTCEQRILVLRVRFDSFLEEAIQLKDNEKELNKFLSTLAYILKV